MTLRVSGSFDPGRLPVVGEVASRLSLLLAYVLVAFAGRSLTRAMVGGEPDMFVFLGVQGAVMTILTGLLWLPLASKAGKIGLRRALRALPFALFVLLPFVVVTVAGRFSWTPPSSRWFATLGLLAAAAVAEEVEFRGLLFDALAFRGSVIPSIVLSSALFGLVHGDNPGSNPLALVNIALFGLMLCGIRMLTRGVAGPALIHWVWNSTTGLVLGSSVSGLELPSLLHPLGRMPWGAFGPEESPALTILLIASTVLVYFSVRRAGRRSAATGDHALPVRADGGGGS